MGHWHIHSPQSHTCQPYTRTCHPKCPKPRQKVPKSVQAVTHHTLLFKANPNVGLGYNGELILGDMYSCRYLHKLQHNGTEYIETWKKGLPDGMMDYCYKRLARDGCIFLQNGTEKNTVCCDKSLTKRTELHIQGELIDSISDELFYGQRTLGKQNWEIIVHKLLWREYLPVVIWQLYYTNCSWANIGLKPPSPHGWCGFLSVCRTEFGYVVVEWDTRSWTYLMKMVDIFFSLKLY